MNILVNLKYVLIFIVLLTGVIAIPSYWKIHQQHQIIIDLRSKNVAQWEKWKNDSTKIVMQAKENKELNNLYASQIRATIRWKNLADSLTVKEIIPDEEFGMDTTTECYYAEAVMNIKTRKGFINVQPQASFLNIDIAYVDKHLSFGRAWTDNECLVFEDGKLNIPDNLNLDCYKESKWPWVIGAIGAGIIVGCIIE